MSNNSKKYRTASTPSGKNEPILIFRGGGYDGCVWERNAVFFTHNEHEVDEIKSDQSTSGYKGEEVLEACRKSLRHGVKSAIEAAYGDRDGWGLITHDASWARFCGEYNEGFVRSIAKLAGRSIPCQGCKEWFDPDEIVHTGYEGNGGIGVVFTDNYCHECAEELHDKWAAKYEWPYLTLRERIDAIDKYNEDHERVSLFAARNKVAPVPCEYYGIQPTFY